MGIREGRVATILASLVLLVAILLPGEDIPKVSIPGLDKLAHVLLFGCWALALRFDWRLFRERPALLIAAVALAGPLSEAMQLFVPDRSFDLVDMAADFVGAALAAAFGAPLVRLADRILPGTPR